MRVGPILQVVSVADGLKTGEVYIVPGLPPGTPGKHMGIKHGRREGP